MISIMKAFGLVGAVVVLMSGCGVESDDESAVEAAAGSLCGDHSGRYTFTVGERIDTGTGCVFSPPSGDVILPDAHSGSSCLTGSSDAHQPVNVIDDSGVVAQFTGESLACRWAKDGSSADCVLSATGIRNDVACSSSVKFHYDRVPVFTW